MLHTSVGILTRYVRALVFYAYCVTHVHWYFDTAHTYIGILTCIVLHASVANLTRCLRVSPDVILCGCRGLLGSKQQLTN